MLIQAVRREAKRNQVLIPARKSPIEDKGVGVHPRRRWDHERPPGEAFNGLGEYFDKCCVLNTAGPEGCRVWHQCRDWWDEYCEETYEAIAVAEMKETIDRFEEARHKWITSLLAGGPATPEALGHSATGKVQEVVPLCDSGMKAL